MLFLIFNWLLKNTCSYSIITIVPINPVQQYQLVYTPIYFVPTIPQPSVCYYIPNQNNDVIAPPANEQYTVLSISQALPFKDSKTTLELLEQMLPPTKRNYTPTFYDKYMQKPIYTKKITLLNDKKKFNNRMINMLRKRRKVLDSQIYYLQETQIVKVILENLEFDEKQCMMFLLYFGFVYRGMSRSNNSFRIENDYLIIRKEIETDLTEQKLVTDLKTWKRFNFSVDTYLEAWKILVALAKRLSDSTLACKAEGHFEAFQSSTYLDMCFLTEIDN